MADEPDRLHPAPPEFLDDRLDLGAPLDEPEQRVRLLPDFGEEALGGHQASGSATWQATRRLEPISRSSGVTLSHFAIA